MTTIPFYIVDVFADAPYKGNQLAVFLNCSKLSTEQMQKIAQEIGFAESVFILSDQASEAGINLRIFTVEYEVPFAGHPTLGSAYIIQQVMWQSPVPKVTINAPIGQIPVTISYTQDKPDFLFMRQVNPFFGGIQDRKEVADLLGMPVESLHPTYPIQEISTGLPFLIVPVNRLKDIQQLQPSAEKLNQFLVKNKLYKTQREDGLSVALYCFCPETYHQSNQINARMLALENGKIIEDAATGSANGCLLSYLLKHKFYKDQLELDLLVEQGYEIGRNATIRLKGKQLSENEFDINVGGQVQLIAKGEWFVQE